MDIMIDGRKVAEKVALNLPCEVRRQRLNDVGSLKMSIKVDTSEVDRLLEKLDRIEQHPAANLLVAAPIAAAALAASNQTRLTRRRLLSFGLLR